MLILITGGTRSGKSSFAQTLCAQNTNVIYIATARPGDDEMRDRIAKHRSSRPASWLTVEEPLAVAEIVKTHASKSNFVLIDCLTLWLSNLFFEFQHDDLSSIERRANREICELTQASQQGAVIAVTNEVGCGIVPESHLARQFRDLQGWVNQQIARAADTVYLLSCGIPLRIKPGSNLSL